MRSDIDKIIIFHAVELHPATEIKLVIENERVINYQHQNCYGCQYFPTRTVLLSSSL